MDSALNNLQRLWYAITTKQTTSQFFNMSSSSYKYHKEKSEWIKWKWQENPKMTSADCFFLCRCILNLHQQSFSMKTEKVAEK